MISYKVRMREYERLKGRLKRAIQSILGTYRLEVSLEQLVEAGPRFLDAPPLSCAEILSILSAKLEKPFITPVHLTELYGLHDGTVNYEALQDYAIFCQAFGPEWGMGGSDLTEREDLLMKIHHAIISVPNRGKVQDVLATLGNSPPSYTDFLNAIKSSPSTTAGGPSGLNYDMMKAWPEEVSRLSFELLEDVGGKACPGLVEISVPSAHSEGSTRPNS